MKSFISIEDVDGKIVACEVENVPVGERNPDEITSCCYQTEVDFELFKSEGYYPSQGEVYSAIHENGNVISICSIEPEERARRMNILMSLF
ncbi:MAG: hypothetical protein IKE01_02725 [Clostridia bacterium]|nr:hypothetical protein [Clostridia bacterium]